MKSLAMLAFFFINCYKLGFQVSLYITEGFLYNFVYTRELEIYIKGFLMDFSKL